MKTQVKSSPSFVCGGGCGLDADPQAALAGIQAARIASFRSLENLVNAYSTLHRYLGDNYDDMPKLKKYWGYLANNVVFIQISTDVSSALKIFETINECGVGLNPMGLLKNLLFTQHVESAFSGVKIPGCLEPFTKLDIKHILPDNSTPELRAKWVSENQEADYDDYKNRLGNLTLLEKPINIVAGNGLLYS